MKKTGSLIEATFVLTRFCSTAIVPVLFVLMLLSASSCQTDRKIVYLRGADTLYASPKVIDQEYELRIQPDDELAITVSSKNQELIEVFNNTVLIGSGNSHTGYSQATLTSNMYSFLVDKSGNIEFPIFGVISTKGKTCGQLAQELQQRLISEGYILDAVVNIKIKSFKITVLGEVKNPGPQVFDSERLTLLEALGKAGDLNASAKRHHVLVVREEDGKRMTYDIDLRDPQSVFQSPAYYLQQNDVVYVTPNTSVRVKGSTGYTLLSVGATAVSMLVSIVSLVLALKRD